MLNSFDSFLGSIGESVKSLNEIVLTDKLFIQSTNTIHRIILLQTLYIHCLHLYDITIVKKSLNISVTDEYSTIILLCEQLNINKDSLFKWMGLTSTTTQQILN